MRYLCLILLGSGCAYISDEHESWRLDPDGDGVGLEEDCDNNDDQIGAPRAWYIDQDEDGFGVEIDVTYQCDAPAGYVGQAGDCDDLNRDVYPGAEELCDGMDNNCDLQIDEDLDTRVFFVDADGDGFGDSDNSEERCGEQPGFVENNTDCDDENPYFREKGPVEIPYNGIDDNCDSLDGDGDQDQDSYWAADYLEKVEGEPMPVPEGKGDDCDDSRADVFPGAHDEPYDGIDSNCGGEDDCDSDLDGFIHFVAEICERPTCDSTDTSGCDCDDGNPDINPSAIEVCDELNADEDCNGDADEVDASGCEVFYFDADEDDYGDSTTGICRCEADLLEVSVGGDCIPSDGDAYPGAFDLPYDGRDADCAGDDDFDYDRDGYVRDEHAGLTTDGVEGSGALPAGDCDDEDSAIFPGADETIADGVDSDCDGFELCYLDRDGDGHAGMSGDTMSSVALDCSDESAALPGAPADDCVDSDPAYHPGAVDEWYDAEDKDCAGNDDFDQDGDGHSHPDYESAETFRVEDGFWSLVEGATAGRLSTNDCDDTNASVNPDADEFCDGIDNDCNLEIDDGARDFSTLYRDDDLDGFGDPDPSLAIESCPVEGYVLSNTDCDDTDGSVYPDAEEACDGVDSDCDGDLVDGFMDLDEGGSPDCYEAPLVDDLADSLLYGLAGGQSGMSLLVGAAGSLYVGAPELVDGFARVYVLDDLADPSLTDLEASANALKRDVVDFGYSLSEINGESGPVLIVGSPDENAIVQVTAPSVGHDVVFVPGDASGGDRFASVAAVPVSGSAERCGHSLTTMAGVDTGSQVIVGCPLKVNGGFIFKQDAWTDHVRFDDLGDDVIAAGADSPYSEEFGFSLGVGDLNGDGIDDAIFGARQDDYLCSGSNCGAAYVYFGDFFGEVPLTDLSVTDADAVIYGDQEEDALGSNVAILEDLEGDGRADVLVSSNHGWPDSSPEAGAGAVLVYTLSDWSGSYAEIDADHTFVDTEPGSQFGLTSALIPDVDGDAQSELVVGAYSSDHGDVDSGALYGFRGAWTDGGGARSTADLDVVRLVGNGSGELGRGLTVGDVGADGAMDIVVSEPRIDHVWILSPATLFPTE